MSDKQEDMKYFADTLAKTLNKTAETVGKIAEQLEANVADAIGDFEKSFQIWKEHADEGYDNAQARLAYMYQEGLGTSQNLTEALKWYEKAAKNGHKEAMHNIGEIYRNGLGAQPNLKKALQWYSKAADLGVTISKTVLGIMYQEGKGVPQDIEEAEKWFRKAANQGEPEAQKRLKKIQKDNQTNRTIDKRGKRGATSTASDSDSVMTTHRFTQFVNLLGQLPDTSWAASVNQLPSCKLLRPLSREWPFGRFATLYVLGGLNNYQLKGRAEVSYWPKILPLIVHGSIPKSPHELKEKLLPFYKAERLSVAKVKRLERFVNSKLCCQIWDSDALIVAIEFLAIWPELARTMKQKRDAKTIVFAMKCLACALLLVGETGFDFGTIPIPVDSRISELSRRLGLISSGGEMERNRWSQVLDNIRGSNPEVTMIHLDSILWQISILSEQQIVTHLLNLGTKIDLAESIAKVIDDK